MLHDRRIPGTRANLDHLVVAPSGIWVVDAKRYEGKVAIAKPLLGEAKLTIGGRDKSTLVDGLDDRSVMSGRCWRNFVSSRRFTAPCASATRTCPAWAT